MRIMVSFELAGVIATSLTGVAAMSAAGPSGNVPPHQHYIDVDCTRVEIVPSVCANPSPPVRVRPHATNRLGERGSKLIAPTLALLAALAAWWGIVTIFEIPDYLLPAPQAVAARIVKEWPLLAKHGVYTLLSVLTGFAAAVAIGVPLATSASHGHTTAELGDEDERTS